MAQWAIGIDLGGTAVKAAVAGRETGVLSTSVTPTATADGPQGIVRQISSIAGDLYRSASVTLDPADFHGIGLGVPGAVDRTAGTLSYPPNLPGWDVVALREELQKSLVESIGLKAPVFLDNDANAAALGEAVYGAGREFSDFLMVTLGTGVGGGIVLNRQLYRGPGGTAGEIGFMIVDFEGTSIHAGIRGTIEGLIGKERIVELARRMIAASPSGSSVGEYCSNDLSRLSPRHIETAALNGDEVCLAVWERVGAILGTGLANVTALMDIRKFVIGGGISGAGELVFGPALSQLRRSTLPSMQEGLELVPAILGNRAGVHGAAALCFSES
ncbi:ROK family protein [Chlorobium phaeovibrioides]|uniref:ROK family protein n=2 Tax=Chlorobium phaeovibrioides TaxID=1094 RepID=A0A3S0L5J8_CHLPH|nr:ROK family protein [Chlorobium phaeovibrioides]HCD36615.1 ROK family protein [Chlorobium sp.]KAA6231937.1 ROK family protein [Chlorobium phaeovibrioides]MWV53559.1 ROK family protein [Chlorobium phaeovibrioides]QEQ57508.1 ROK family protein [Chlorobium phaeovibrioides]RTY36138.1 ROK family protein [Chlorobium phaeovibrioides]